MSPVLVVEDNEINAEIIMTLLEEYGIPGELAVDGIDSVEKCTDKPKDYYSLILMDIHMPRMNGYEAARKIKMDLGINAPIVAQTATHTTEISIKEHGEYIIDYLYKPFKPDQLFAILQRFVV
ncbi:MAG: response regulator [Spirochaetales bacterium]|nr:response regulator [Spirochaetales bacterium]HNQ97078.1 response regulator [Treponemataceae bacterium]